MNTFFLKWWHKFEKIFFCKRGNLTFKNHSCYFHVLSPRRASYEEMIFLLFFIHFFYVCVLCFFSFHCAYLYALCSFLFCVYSFSFFFKDIFLCVFCNCSSCLLVYSLDVDELELFNSFKGEFHNLKFVNLIVIFLRRPNSFKRSLEGQKCC